MDKVAVTFMLRLPEETAKMLKALANSERRSSRGQAEVYLLSVIEREYEKLLLKEAAKSAKVETRVDEIVAQVTEEEGK